MKKQIMYFKEDEWNEKLELTEDAKNLGISLVSGDSFHVLTVGDMNLFLHRDGMGSDAETMTGCLMGGGPIVFQTLVLDDHMSWTNLADILCTSLFADTYGAPHEAQ